VSHENSNTIQDEYGNWINVSGYTGAVLKPTLPSEKHKYNTVEEAVEQARLRSKSFDTHKENKMENDLGQIWSNTPKEIRDLLNEYAITNGIPLKGLFQKYIMEQGNSGEGTRNPAGYRPGAAQYTQGNSLWSPHFPAVDRSTFNMDNPTGPGVHKQTRMGSSNTGLMQYTDEEYERFLANGGYNVNVSF
jgi:hypothetical protein